MAKTVKKTSKKATSVTIEDKLKAKNWLDSEISKIIELYKDDNSPIEIRLDAIEQAINKSFAGTGIARFVVGKVWDQSTELAQQRLHSGLVSIISTVSIINNESVNQSSCGMSKQYFPLLSLVTKLKLFETPIFCSCRKNLIKKSSS